MSDGVQEIIYLDIDGLKRRYVLYRPRRIIESGERTPAIIMLDGRGGTAWTAMRTTRWNDKADREGFAMIYPEATRIDPEGPLHFLTNPQMWDAGTGGSDVERPPVDDVAFLRAVIDSAREHARIDASRIFMTGFSNGAAMTYRFALAFPELLAAIAPVSGHLRMPDATLTQSVPMISLFGRLDPLSRYDGGEIDLPWGRREDRPPAITSVHAWAKLCGHDPGDGQMLTEPGVSRLVYGQTGARDEIHFITIDDLGHTWPGGHRLIPESIVGATSDRVIANDEIWSFFQNRV